MKKIVEFLLTFLVFAGLIGAIIFLGFKNHRGLFFYLAQQAGFAPEFDYVSGTGSMYPTFPRGTGKSDLENSKEVVAGHNTRRYPGGIVFFNKRYFGYELKRGDIVFFANAKTRDIIAKEASSSSDLDTGFVKRVIALPKDKIEIRDGFVKLNNQILSEPYIAKAKSTYGGDFLPDCKILTVPDGYVFVMGDNRKGSNDSRFDLQLVALDDIRTVIPIDDQKDLTKNWRDTSKDTNEANKPVFDISTYMKLINAKRKAQNIPQLSYKKELEQSAQKRARIIIKFNDTSFEATKSGYTMKKAMNEVGYANTVWGELPAVGYYEAEELVDNYFQFPNSKKFILNPEFSETGISTEVGEINGCPVQIVVQHLAGYIPPNYPKTTIDNWEKLVANLEEAFTSWEKIKNSQPANKNDFDRLLELIKKRKDNAQIILSQMKNNLWLTNTQEQMANEDSSLHEEIINLVNKLNQN